MLRNWLIRTKNRQILGPVSREKILELLEKGSLADKDELCSGNGYWFYVKEKNLIQKYLIGNEKQAFNFVNQAEDDDNHPSVLGNESSPTQAPQGNVKEEDLAYPDMGGKSVPSSGSKMPSANDLELPNMNPTSPVEEKQTQSVGGAAPKEKPVPNQASANGVAFPSGEDLDFPEMVTAKVEKKTEEIVVPKEISRGGVRDNPKGISKRNDRREATTRNVPKGQPYLKVLLYILVALFVLLIFIGRNYAFDKKNFGKIQSFSNEWVSWEPYFHLGGLDFNVEIEWDKIECFHIKSSLFLLSLQRSSQEGWEDVKKKCWSEVNIKKKKMIQYALNNRWQKKKV